MRQQQICKTGDEKLLSLPTGVVIAALHSPFPVKLWMELMFLISPP